MGHNFKILISSIPDINKEDHSVCHFTLILSVGEHIFKVFKANAVLIWCAIKLRLFHILVSIQFNKWLSIQWWTKLPRSFPRGSFQAQNDLQVSKHGIPKVQSTMMEVGRCGSTEDGNLKPIMKHAWVDVGVGFEESFPQVGYLYLHCMFHRA